MTNAAEFTAHMKRDLDNMRRPPGWPKDPTTPVKLSGLSVFGERVPEADGLSTAIADLFMEPSVGVLRSNARALLARLIQGRVNLERRDIAAKIRAKARENVKLAKQEPSRKERFAVIADVLGATSLAIKDRTL